MTSSILTLGEKAKAAKESINMSSVDLRNAALEEISKSLVRNIQNILEQNKRDLDNGARNGMSDSLMDRLRLNEERILSISKACVNLSLRPDPVGVIEGGCTRPNGLRITKIRVPFGVVGIIYEARPNVTVDAAALCIKSGNAVILRGGKEAFFTNLYLVSLIREALESVGLDPDCVQFVEDTTRATALDMMRLNSYIDVLIPRGGASLIKTVVENATVPVIETGVGNCHIYVDMEADISMALDIICNAKTQRPSVCNAVETLLVHRAVAEDLLPRLQRRFTEHKVQIRGCELTRMILGNSVVPVTDDDYAREFLDYILAVRVVDSFQEAIEHIKKYSTGHSECIITGDIRVAEEFQRRIDAAAVYVNASTRFTDGEEFGMGAEIGISTQKLHARGPMGLEALTTTKYLVNGNGQIR